MENVHVNRNIVTNNMKWGRFNFSYLKHSKTEVGIFMIPRAGLDSVVVKKLFKDMN